MRKKMKALSGEELPVTILVIILLVFFILSAFSSYTSFFHNAGYMEDKRTASMLAERIFFENDGVIKDISSAIDQYGREGVELEITTDGGPSGKAGSLPPKGERRSVAVSSVAILVEDGGVKYPGRLVVSVGE